MYVANRASDKITQLKDNVYVCRPGSDTDLMKLRTNGLPPYLPQMDDMFQGNTVINDVSSDEEAGEEEDDLTPMSIGNKRASSSSTTASSPSKRSKSLAVRSINSLMTTYNEIARERLQLQKEMHRENKQMQENIRMELSWKIAECTRIAEQEMGLSADTPTLLDGLFYLSKSESYMDLFLSSTSEAVRMRIIEKLAHNNAPVQNYGYASTRKELLTQLKNEEDELLSELMADEEEDEFILGMYQYALYIDKYLTRAEYRVSKVTGLEWVHAKLSNEKASYNMFRMTPTMFISLHDLLVEKYGLKSTTKSSSIEALGMFLWMVGAPESVRQAEDRFERSLGTVSKMFNKVLNCLVKLAADIIKPVDPEFKTLNPRLRNPKFYPYFKNCIGAIDGTHVQCVVPNDMFVQHMCRKGITTQNVMACCDFDMRFTFVIAGWPGSVHDMRVFNDSTTTYNVVFPHPPQGKYYLVDSGYANRQGYLAPYKGTKYHLQEFQDAHKPEGKEEIFNYTHSSLRNVIERSFGVLKMKWRILQKIPPYAHEKQSRIIVACMALHNFMRSSGIPDKHFHRCDTNENYMPRQAYENQPTPEVVDDVSNVMSVLRDSLAYALANRS